jgi:hypothetical protein
VVRLSDLSEGKSINNWVIATLAIVFLTSFIIPQNYHTLRPQPQSSWTYDNSQFNTPTCESLFTTIPCRLSQKVIENEKRLQEALDELLKGQHPSIRTTAEAHDLNHVTLGRRMNGGRSIVEAREGHQNLSIAEEKALSQWITHMAATEHLVR